MASAMRCFVFAPAPIILLFLDEAHTHSDRHLSTRHLRRFFFQWKGFVSYITMHYAPETFKM